MTMRGWPKASYRDWNETWSAQIQRWMDNGRDGRVDMTWVMSLEKGLSRGEISFAKAKAMEETRQNEGWPVQFLVMCLYKYIDIDIYIGTCIMSIYDYTVYVISIYLWVKIIMRVEHAQWRWRKILPMSQDVTTLGGTTRGATCGAVAIPRSVRHQLTAPRHHRALAPERYASREPCRDHAATGANRVRRDQPCLKRNARAKGLNVSWHSQQGAAVVLMRL